MTVKKISRNQWEQIMKRCRRAKWQFSSDKCLICGKNFKGHECLHSVHDNDAVLAEAKRREGILQ